MFRGSFWREFQLSCFGYFTSVFLTYFSFFHADLSEIKKKEEYPLDLGTAKIQDYENNKVGKANDINYLKNILEVTEFTKWKINLS
jgi:hypothetical protein